MVAVHGSKAFFSVTDAGAVARDLSGYIDESGLPRSADTAEVTTGGMNSKKYIPGLLDGTIPIGGPLDVTVDGYLNGILGMADRTFIYRPQGVGTGFPSYTGLCILQSYEPSTPVDDAGTFSGEFQLTGDVVRTVQ